MSEYNIRERFHSSCDGETWPPDQPKHFVPMLLVHQQGQSIREKVAMLPQLIQTGDIDIDEIPSVASNQSVPKHHSEPGSHKSLQEVLDSSKVTKELTEILVSLERPTKDPQFILIEGAPGIGKSFLLKEIAYRWSNKQMLKTFKLVLLVPLRDPAVQQASLVKDLLQLFCNRGDTRDAEIATACSEYLVQNGGKDLAVLFDGFDEYPEVLQKNSLISDILKRKVLPYCALVVSSRPHVTVHLREQATFTVDVLGLPKLERNRFIQQALKDDPQRLAELTEYLEDHSSISGLCVVPFHIVVLLFLYKKGIPLPNNSTELYNHFICLTICRHLAKYGHPLDNTITNLSDLPDPYHKIIQQLSKFSFEALDSNKLIFTYDDIKVACPDIVAIPGAVNGFGLLQAIQHFGLTGQTMTFNFLHFTIQEFLAAHHVSSLSPCNELAVLKEKFWSDFHFNTFAIYIALTKGNQPSFKQFIKPSLVQRFLGFLTGEQAINRFVDDPVKCFYLFQCFFKAGDTEICRSIESVKIFNEKKIIINNSGSSPWTFLSPSDVERLTFFLTHSSHRGWKELSLPFCFIHDHGLYILHQALKRCDVTISELNLCFNGLTKSASSTISDITISCKLNVLKISGNQFIGENEGLYSIMSDPSSVLEILCIRNAKLSSSGAIQLFTALSDNKKLRTLIIDSNNITDRACGAIVTALKKNTSLIKMSLIDNPISGECLQLIVQALQDNSSLQRLWLSYMYSENVKERIRLLQSAAEIMRKEKILEFECIYGYVLGIYLLV